MIKTEINIKGIKYTIRAQNHEILDQTIRDLKKLHKKSKKTEEDNGI